jgi:hypothetical protein
MADLIELLLDCLPTSLSARDHRQVAEVVSRWGDEVV